jgi:hypothetical protein
MSLTYKGEGKSHLAMAAGGFQTFCFPAAGLHQGTTQLGR